MNRQENKRLNHKTKNTIKKLIIGLICIINTFVCIWPVNVYAAESQKKVIKVGWYESYNFQEGMTDDAKKSGYSYDYLQKVADSTGWTYEYVYGDWTDLLSKLERGEIDLLGGVSITEERKEKMSFPDYYMGKESYYLFKNSAVQEMTSEDPSSFVGKKIGAIRNNLMTNYLEKWISDNNIPAEIVYYDGFTDRDNDFAKGIIDGITSTDNNIGNTSGYSPVAKIGEEKFYLAVSQSRTDILTELNTTLKLIDKNDPAFIDNLEQKNYGSSLINNVLSDEEVRWLSTHSKLRVGYAKDYMPFSGVDEKGQVTGIVVDIVGYIVSKFGIDEYITLSYIGYDSFADMAEGINKGDIDLSFPVMSEKSYQDTMKISGSSDVVTVSFYVAFKGNYTDSVFNTIALNSRPLQKITDEYASSEILKVDTAEKCLDAVVKGDATCTVMSSYRLQYLLNDPKYNEINMMPFGASTAYCFGASSNNRELLSIIDKGLILIDRSVITDRVFNYIQEGKMYTPLDFVRDNVLLVIELGLFVFLIIIVCLALYICFVKKSKAERDSQLEQITQLNTQLQENLDMVNIFATLSQDYASVHMIDLDEESFTTYSTSQGMINANFDAKIAPYSETVTNMVKTFVLPEYEEEFLELLEIENLKRIINEKGKFSHRYAIKPDESGSYMYEMTFVKLTDIPDRNLVVVGSKCIDDILKIEREEGQYNAALLHDCLFFYGFDITTGEMDGQFKTRKGYDPLFGLELEFPMKYDDFNRIRAERLHFETPTANEKYVWTCEGLKKAYAQGKRTVDIRYRSDEMDYYWSAVVIISEDEHSHHLHGVYISKDVTGLVKNENKQRRQLENALLEAQRANVAKSEFLSRMSHDIRTPLNGIIGLMEINEKHKDDKELVDKNRQKARVAADHLLSLINDVLDMSKLDGGLELPNEPFNVFEVCKDSFAINSIRAKENGITMTNDNGVEFKYPNVYGSPLHLKQILVNLFSNAIKYNRPGGSVWAETHLISYDGNTVVYNFIVKDTGIGMSREFMEHLYQPFTQERSDARSVYQGTGLGMAIVKTLVERMGGTIECESEEGLGTTFTVTIPFKVNHDIVIENDDVEALPVDAIRGMRILLAEDNELNSEIACTILEDAGAIMTTAENGRVALEKFIENEPGSFDIILMDIMMPVMDGYSATKAIRTSGKEDAAIIPIVAMTANAFAEDVQRAKEAGMNGHLAKPLQIDKLMKTLANYSR